MINIITIRLICIISLILILAPFYCEASADLVIKKDVYSILDNLTSLVQDDEIDAKLNSYLAGLTSFSNIEHQLAIKETGIRYYKSIIDLSECIELMNKDQVQPSSKWFEDMKTTFDMKYIQNNVSSIKFIMFAISAINNKKYCEICEKNAIYYEIMYRDILADYMRKLQRFSEGLNDKGRPKINNIIRVINSFLEGPKYPLQVLLSDENGTLFSAALKNRKELDPKLVLFFSTHPFFQKTFDPMRTFKELEDQAQINAEY